MPVQLTTWLHILYSMVHTVVLVTTGIAGGGGGGGQGGRGRAAYAYQNLSWSLCVVIPEMVVGSGWPMLTASAS